MCAYCRLRTAFRVALEAAVVDQMVDDGLGGVAGIGFAIGQPIAQIGCQMAAEKR